MYSTIYYLFVTMSLMEVTNNKKSTIKFCLITTCCIILIPQMKVTKNTRSEDIILTFILKLFRYLTKIYPTAVANSVVGLRLFFNFFFFFFFKIFFHMHSSDCGKCIFRSPKTWSCNNRGQDVNRLGLYVYLYLCTCYICLYICTYYIT